MERNQRTMESMELNQIIAGTPHPIQTTSLPMDNKSSKGASGNPDKVRQQDLIPLHARPTITY